jgi:hypothetical protein
LLGEGLTALPGPHVALFHHGGAVTALQFLEPVGDPQGGEWLLGAVAELVDQLEGVALAGGIEEGGGFIQEQQAGLAGQGPGNR